ncbi:predicted protein [Sclerotinia sclerotiorum 1980 UF-70]|uniref:Uncharacterized protein n=1 Tax=Sclerotinia sclerotiorum (strain ATCC 18683 / 1980 / Ss-1) TaxID=665079 RepID=A7ERU7_SCLS1|nr:predicted protein [Sclerotinia sclerotiorum 1980 UF-70]EDN92189.1 predicted protein [Sclerotinia sclerotiorum 1980 UF-70]
MDFSRERLQTGLEDFLLSVATESLPSTETLILSFSLLENKRYKLVAEKELSRWLENDAKYNTFDGSYHEGFGERFADYEPGPRPTALPFNQAPYDSYDLCLNADHRNYCHRKEIKMGILSHVSYTSEDTEWDFSQSSVSSLQCRVENSKEIMAKYMVAYNVVQELVREYQEMFELSADRYVDVEFRLNVRKDTEHRLALRSDTRLNPPGYLSCTPTLDSLGNQMEKVTEEVLSIGNRLKFLENVVSTINDAKSDELSNLMSLVRRLRFAEERFILQKPKREFSLPAEIWSNILEKVMPNIQTINSNNGKLDPMLERWKISKVLFRTVVPIYYREAIFSFTPHSFMNCTTVKIMKKITIHMSSPEWYTHAIGTECACDLPKTTTAIEAYTLQKRLKECTALVELRLIQLYLSYLSSGLYVIENSRYFQKGKCLWGEEWRCMIFEGDYDQIS